MAKRQTSSAQGKNKKTSGKQPAGNDRGKRTAQAQAPAPRHSLGLDLAALVLIGCGIFFFISLLGDGTGILGGSVKRVLFGLFGLGSYGVALMLALFGVLILLEYVWSPRAFDYWMGTLLFVGILLFIHLAGTAQGKGPVARTLREYLPLCYATGQSQQGGGFFGGLLLYPCVLLVGRAGTWIADIVLILATLVGWTGLSLRRVSRSITTHVAQRVDSWQRVREENRRRREVLDFQELGWEDEGSQEEMPSRPVHPETWRAADGLDMDFDAEESAPAGEEEADDSMDLEEAFARELQAREEEIPVPETPQKNPTASSSKKREEPAPALSIETDAKPAYTFPPISLLSRSKNPSRPEDATLRARKLEETFRSFGIRAEVTNVSCGPAITQFEVHPAPGVKSASIVNLANDIALNLAAPSVRIEAPIPGKAAIGVEIPNKTTAMVKLRDVLESPEFSGHKSKVAFCLGRDIVGQNVVADIARMPHLLIAGATGSGKSVCINSIIVSLLYKATPQEVRMIMIDPKVVELGVYNGIPHLLIPVVTDPKKAAGALNWAVSEMSRRYQLFAENKTRNIQGYNELVEKEEDKLPSIVIIIDELADLMMVAPGDVEDAICRLAQLARAAGMYLIIATQRPSVDVITGVIKANIPSRIAFAVSSQVDSRTILDMTGAEKLLGKGDMLYSPAGAGKAQRVQGCFVPEEEVEEVVAFITQGLEEQEYDGEILEQIDRFEATPKGKGRGAARDEEGAEPGRSLDPLLRDVVDTLYDQQQLSISMVQRKMGVGYARAARIVDQLETLGIVAEGAGAKPRAFLKSRQEIYETLDSGQEGDE